jgi:hypothetical protein
MEYPHPSWATDISWPHSMGFSCAQTLPDSPHLGSQSLSPSPQTCYDSHILQQDPPRPHSPSVYQTYSHLPATCSPLPARPGPFLRERREGAASWQEPVRGPTMVVAPSAPGQLAWGPTALGDAVWRLGQRGGAGAGEEGKSKDSLWRQLGAHWEQMVLALAPQPSSPFPGPARPTRHLWPQAALNGQNQELLGRGQGPWPHFLKLQHTTGADPQGRWTPVCQGPGKGRPKFKSRSISSKLPGCRKVR